MAPPAKKFINNPNGSCSFVLLLRSPFVFPCFRIFISLFWTVNLSTVSIWGIRVYACLWGLLTLFHMTNCVTVHYISSHCALQMLWPSWSRVLSKLILDFSIWMAFLRLFNFSFPFCLLAILISSMAVQNLRQFFVSLDSQIKVVLRSDVSAANYDKVAVVSGRGFLSKPYFWLIEFIFVLCDVILKQEEEVGMNQHKLGTWEKECWQRLFAAMFLLRHRLIPS